MRRRINIYSLFVLACLVISPYSRGEIFAPPQVNVSVTVVDEDETPIEGAEVQGLFKGMGAGGVDDTIVKRLTDSEGLTRLSGRTRLWVSLTVRKEGYYHSNQEIKAVEWDRKTKKNVYSSDQAVTLVLREVRNPVPMYVYREAKPKVPELHKPIGFDLMQGDWVAPHGEGKVEDVFFRLTGEWTSFNDHDSYLHVTFPNSSDGIQSFAASSQSAFKSPYEAPIDGYLTKLSLRKGRIPVEGFRDNSKVIDETSHTANYIFRVRTVLNQVGEVKEALYGKIYGDFVFVGASTEERYQHIVFTYYLNPTPNDLNLECDPKQNLMEGIESWNQPDSP